MPFSQWSTTPADNATGVTDINWQEGQAPSSVNNSARQMMADLATAFGTGATVQFTAIELGHATQNTLTASGGNLSIENNVVYRAGGTDVPVTDGGTGASDVAGAQTNLGFVNTANSPGANEWARFTDADTIEGRTTAELITTLNAANTIQTVTANWKGDTGDPALVNGTTACRVEKHGNFLWVYIEVVMGSSTTYGTGNWYFTLPSPYDGNAAYNATGSGFVLDSGTAIYLGTPYIVSGTNKIYMVAHNSANFFNSTVPFSWATSDYLKFSIMYPLA